MNLNTLFSTQIYQNKMVPEATLKTVFPREIGNSKCPIK